MDRTKWFIRRSISCQQEYKVKNSYMLRPDFCDYNAAYIVVKGKITVEYTDVAEERINKNIRYKTPIC